VTDRAKILLVDDRPENLVALEAILGTMDYVLVRARSGDEALKALLTLIPYGRIGVPEDIGNAAVWLASDASDYVHGQTIFVDGGMTLYPEFAHGG